MNDKHRRTLGRKYMRTTDRIWNEISKFLSCGSLRKVARNLQDEFDDVFYQNPHILDAFLCMMFDTTSLLNVGPPHFSSMKVRTFVSVFSLHHLPSHNRL